MKAPIAKSETASSAELASLEDRPTATAAKMINVAGFTAVSASKLAYARAGVSPLGWPTASLVVR
jgi:hypothetical protein